MRQILFDDDVVDVVNSFLMVNDGDTETKNLILAIGAELLDVTEDTMVEMINEMRNRHDENIKDNN